MSAATASYQRVDNAVIDLTYVVQSRSMTDAWVKDSQQTFKFPIPFIQQPIYQITPSVVIQASVPFDLLVHRQNVEHLDAIDALDRFTSPKISKYLLIPSSPLYPDTHVT